jgi:hypothetical protein
MKQRSAVKRNAITDELFLAEATRAKMNNASARSASHLRVIAHTAGEERKLRQHSSATANVLAKRTMPKDDQ